MKTQILTVSSKDQISLPVSIRKLLSVDTGDKLIAYTSGDVIMLKTLKLPTAGFPYYFSVLKMGKLTKGT